MKFGPFYKNYYIILGIDIILIAGSLFAAHLLRFDFDIPRQNLFAFIQILPFVLITKVVCFLLFDLYRGMWRYTSLSDLINIIKASTISSLIIISFILFITRFKGFSRSVFIIDYCFTILLISGFRIGVRFYFEHFSDDKFWAVVKRTLIRLFTHQQSCRRLLIIGAGDCGEKIYREIRDNAGLRYNVVGFLDDYPVKIGKKIHGIPVLGSIRDIKMVAGQIRAHEALIAIPSASSQQMRDIIEHCKKSGIIFKTIPSMGELINGHITVNAIRDVAYRDLLGREVINLDEEKISGYINKQCIMITGAGGSIGSELCRQICRFQPEQIILYEWSETLLYELELELQKSFPGVKVVPLLADIRNQKQLEKTFEILKPKVIFHAAAYKHVPMLENQPWKAVENNIEGTKILIETAHRYEVERFVFVSTDKAVRPVNVMGATKRVAELLSLGQNGFHSSNTRFMIVRFGNVVGSSGSVVPLFKKQIQDGGPVTVTHKEMARYFMIIPEACQLILQAGAMGEGGEIFLLDMGMPIKIDDMARDLIRLSGLEPDIDIKIDYIGLRPGEKLYEELITEGEGIVPTTHEKIMVLKGAETDLNRLNGNIDALIKLAEDQDEKKIKKKLQEIVPEYQPCIS